MKFTLGSLLASVGDHSITQRSHPAFPKTHNKQEEEVNMMRGEAEGGERGRVKERRGKIEKMKIGDRGIHGNRLLLQPKVNDTRQLVINTQTQIYALKLQLSTVYQANFSHGLREP